MHNPRSAPEAVRPRITPKPSSRTSTPAYSSGHRFYPKPLLFLLSFGAHFSIIGSPNRIGPSLNRIGPCVRSPPRRPRLNLEDHLPDPAHAYAPLQLYPNFSLRAYFGRCLRLTVSGKRTFYNTFSIINIERGPWVRLRYTARILGHRASIITYIWQGRAMGAAVLTKSRRKAKGLRPTHGASPDPLTEQPDPLTDRPDSLTEPYLSKPTPNKMHPASFIYVQHFPLCIAPISPINKGLASSMCALLDLVVRILPQWQMRSWSCSIDLSISQHPTVEPLFTLIFQVYDHCLSASEVVANIKFHTLSTVNRIIAFYFNSSYIFRSGNNNSLLQFSDDDLLDQKYSKLYFYFINRFC
jgi:hypothetical protein